jgi:hypothetical protein
VIGADHTTALSDVSLEPDRARQVVCRAVRQDADRNIVSRGSREKAVNRPVSAHRNQSEPFGAMRAAERIDHGIGWVDNQRNLPFR